MAIIQAIEKITFNQNWERTTGGAASVVRAGNVRAKATLTVTAPGLEGASATIQCK